MFRCFGCRVLTPNSNRLCATCTCPICDDNFFECGHRCESRNIIRNRLGRAIGQCINLALPDHNLCDECTCPFETRSGRCSNPVNCPDHFGQCANALVHRGASNSLPHLQVMTLDTKQQEEHLFFLLERHLPYVLCQIVLDCHVFGTSTPTCINCRCNYQMADGTRCSNNYDEKCHICAIPDCGRKISSGQLCHSHFMYACGIDGCTSYERNCYTHGCKNCRYRTMPNSPYCKWCSCPCCGPSEPFHERHVCDVCHDWTRSPELEDQVADTRPFELFRDRMRMFSDNTFFVHMLNGQMTPINVCPRCIVQGACAIDAVIGPDKCTHPECWLPTDHRFFGSLM
jgi:hypothetical protein